MKGYITVKDAFMNCDREKLRDIVREQYDWTENQEKCVQLTLDFLEQAVKRKPNPGGWINIITVQPEEIISGEEIVTILNTSSSGFRAKTDENDTGVSEQMLELVASKGIKYLGLIKQMADLKPEDCNGGAYDLCPVDEVLAYYIPLETADNYGMESVLSAILYEMTFFGFDIRKDDEEKEKIVDGIIEGVQSEGQSVSS